MSFADEVMAQVRQQGPRCTICEWLNSLPEKERSDYAEVLGDRGFQATAIVRALKARGFDYGVDTVRRHRNGECKVRRK